MSSKDELMSWVDYACNGIHDASGAQKAFRELTNAITELVGLRQRNAELRAELADIRVRFARLVNRLEASK
ncbi:MAG: hypothetical protein Q7O66_16590 [Dehalococcoidia bacterium]|nr:hypothetical protein [Dehalococcoidia bacterium]